MEKKFKARYDRDAAFNQDAHLEIEDPYLDERRIVQRLLHEYDKYGQLIIGYDYDYTLHNHKDEKWIYPKVEQLLRDWESRAKFVICTSSAPSRHEEIIKDLESRNIPTGAINECPMGFGGKVFNNILLDDRAGLGECYRVLRATLNIIKIKEEEVE